MIKTKRIKRGMLLALVVIGLLPFETKAQVLAPDYVFRDGNWVSTSRLCPPKNEKDLCLAEIGEFCNAGFCSCRWGATEIVKGANNEPQVICSLLAKGGGGGGGALGWIIGQIVIWLTALTVMAAMVGMVIGGYYYMTAGGNADNIRQAKVWMGAAILAIFLALAAYAILNFISPALTP